MMIVVMKHVFYYYEYIWKRSTFVEHNSDDLSVYTLATGVFNASCLEFNIASSI